MTQDEHQDHLGEGGGDLNVSLASVADMELVAALLDVEEGEGVEEGEEDQGQQVEEHQGHGGGDLQYSTNSKVQYSTVQYSIAQYNTVQYSIMQTLDEGHKI